ncbi:MAG: hypothetical protein JWQ96_2257 [Segetibacter sp.]|nr:hypothetical protein [Segetibacter sp.]
MRKTILAALIITATTLFASCTNYGKKVKINDHLEVYIKKDATEEEGKKLGEYLQSLDTENKNQKSIQLQKENDLFTVRLVVPDDALKNTELESSFQALQMLIKENVFPGKTVRLILSDDKFSDKRTVKELDPGPSTNDPAINAPGENTTPGELRSQGGVDQDTVGGKQQ